MPELLELDITLPRVSDREMWSKVKQWGYLVLLTLAPLLTGGGEVLSREFPATDQFFNHPINIVKDVLLPSVMQPTIAMVLVGGFLGVILAGRRANRLSSWS